MKAPLELVVTLAVDSPLYAPIFIAQEAGFFGSRPVALGVLKRDGTHAGNSPTSTGNARHSFFQRQVEMISALFENRLPSLVTVCDPIHALLHNSIPGKQRKVRLVGVLIQRPACWFFDRTDRWDEFRQKVERKLSEKEQKFIQTHPPGMTAETLARWALHNKAGVPLSKLDSILDPVTQPGDELDGFNGRRSRKCAAVSLEYHRMLDLCRRAPQDVGICLRYSDEVELESYLMTGILARVSDLYERSDDVERILAGIELGLRLLHADLPRSIALLEQHYAKRRYAEIGPALLERRDYLDHLRSPTTPNAFLHEMIETCMVCYPENITPSTMDAQISQTWGIYRNVQEKLLSAARYEGAGPGDLEVHRLGAAPAVKLRNATLTGLCLSYGIERLLPAKHTSTPVIVQWLKGVKELRASDLQAVGWFLVPDPAKRAVVRQQADYIVDGVRRMVSGSSSEPLAFLVTGPSGCGKGAFTKSLESRLLRDRLIGGWIERNLLTDDKVTRKQLLGGIAAELRRKGKWPRGIWIDECDKHSEGLAALGWFCPAIRIANSWLDDARIARNEAKRTIWLFAGTIHGGNKAVAATIRGLGREKAGPDFMDRLTDRHIVTLPAADPLDLLLRAVSVSQIDDNGTRLEPHPETMTAELLLRLGTLGTPARDVSVQMDIARARLKPRARAAMTLDNFAYRGVDATDFRRQYSAEIDEVGNRAIPIIWDV